MDKTEIRQALLESLKGNNSETVGGYAVREAMRNTMQFDKLIAELDKMVDTDILAAQKILGRQGLVWLLADKAVNIGSGVIRTAHLTEDVIDVIKFSGVFYTFTEKAVIIINDFQ